jgi:flagella basal body P-ring formation protein FlgA
MTFRRKWLTIGFLVCFLAYAGSALAITISEIEIRHIVKGHIEKNMPWESGAMRMEFPIKIEDQQFQAKKLSWMVQNPRTEDYIGESVFAIKFYDRGVFIREVPVRVKMEAAFDIVVSSRPLARDTILGPNDVKVVKKWFDSIPPQNLVTQVDDVYGKNIASSVRANCEIMQAMLKSAQMVRKGSIVKIMAENGSLLVTTIGLSQDNGGQGDIIKVKNLTSNKIVYAKVIDQALVRVDF